MKLFVTGISTDVGKTIASAIVVEALNADYWKPIQAGDLENSDTLKVKKLVQNKTSHYHESTYSLNTPASPHFAALIDSVAIEMKNIIVPETKNHLVIEGAGGVFVPLNNSDCVIDLIQNDFKVIVVSRHYLGSINHTLLTIEALKNRKILIAGIIFSGDENKATEEIILSKTNVKMIGRIDNEPFFDQNVISCYADIFREKLLNLE